MTPNTALLTTPLPTSRQTSTPFCWIDQKLPGSMPIRPTATSQAPRMPIAVKRMASSGIEIMPAMKRGASTRWRGSIAISSSAAICSPAFMRPISAVSEVPARPANSSAVTTGPSSRESERLTIRPSDSAAP